MSTSTRMRRRANWRPPERPPSPAPPASGLSSFSLLCRRTSLSTFRVWGFAGKRVLETPEIPSSGFDGQPGKSCEGRPRDGADQRGGCYKPGQFGCRVKETDRDSQVKRPRLVQRTEVLRN